MVSLYVNVVQRANSVKEKSYSNLGNPPFFLEDDS
jgi:hypothetical protein